MTDTKNQNTKAHDSAAIPLPPLTRAAVQSCVFSAWYPLFRKHTPKATVVKPLPSEFIEYLKCDRLFAPIGSEDLRRYEPAPNTESHYSDVWDQDDDEQDDEYDEDALPKYEFPELDKQVRQIIQEYGSVFPKLNWSSAQDGQWMNNNLECRTPADVYLLLKSSDFVTHDLLHAYEDCVDVEEEQNNHATHFELVLKKWFQMPRAHEFRCFVRSRRLLAITQRDINFYEFLLDKEFQKLLLDKVNELFQQHIIDTFPQDDYVFDVYLTRKKDRLFIVDFNPYALRTDTYLLSWSELDSLWRKNAATQIRMIESSEQVATLGGSMPAFSSNRYPHEAVMMSNGADIAEFTQKWKDAVHEAQC